MHIAYTIAPAKGDTDLALFTLADTLIEDGLRLAGTVQINTERECEGPCDMDVKVLPDGPIVRISQSLGRHAKGCRLDPEALEDTVGHVSRTLSSQVNLLIINKFGKHEAMGRGFRDVIADAIARDIPVLVGLNGLNKEAFLSFVAGEATALAPDLDALRDWVHGVSRAAPRAA